MVLAVLLAWTLRIPFVGHVPFPDEGGLLLVAGSWHTGGPQLYGWLFVDRPPGVLLFFLLAHALGGVVAARLLGLGLVLLLVAAAGRAGWLLAGRRGAAWAAWAAAALAANPLLGTHEINAELVGVPLVMASCALTLDAVRGDRGGRLLFAAGLLAGAAPMVKQNLVDALVFAVALVAATAHRDRWSRPRAAAGLGWLGLGASVPLLATVLWAGGPGPGVGVLWEALVQFRVMAAEVVASTPSPAMDSAAEHAAHPRRAQRTRLDRPGGPLASPRQAAGAGHDGDRGADRSPRSPGPRSAAATGRTT